jgi:hypothetical protein
VGNQPRRPFERADTGVHRTNGATRVCRRPMAYRTMRGMALAPAPVTAAGGRSGLCPAPEWKEAQDRGGFYRSAAAAGFQMYLSKPANPNELIAVVSSLGMIPGHQPATASVQGRRRGSNPTHETLRASRSCPLLRAREHLRARSGSLGNQRRGIGERSSTWSVSA